MSDEDETTQDHEIPAETAAGAVTEPDTPAPRKRHWLRWSLIGLGVLLAVAVIAPTAFVLSLKSSADSRVVVLPSADVFPADTARPDQAEKAKTATNILLMGSDSEEPLDGFQDVRGHRSDTIMVINIPADGSMITVMSIMRDSWVEVPGHGLAKINAAISWGGVPLAVQTIEAFVGVRMDHVAIVDFQGFKAIADALGGVTVYNSKAFKATHKPHTVFAQGDVTMNGEQALAYVRERYSFGDGDYQRIKNQQQFVKAVLKKLVDAGTLLDPLKLQAVVDQTAPYVSVDEGLTVTEMISISQRLQGAPGTNLRFFTAPTLGPGTAGSQSIIKVDWSAMADVQAAFKNDSVAAYAEAHS